MSMTDEQRFEYASAFILTLTAAYARENLNLDVDMTDEDEEAIAELAQRLTVDVIEHPEGTDDIDATVIDVV